MTEAETNIAHPRDWVLLTPAVVRIVSFVGKADAPARTNSDLRGGRLRAALVAPDGTIIKVLKKEDWQQRTVRVPLNPAEGVSVEPPFEEGRVYIWRGLDEWYPENPATPTTAADRQLPAADGPEPSQSSQAQQLPPATPPDELAIADPAPASASAADVEDQSRAAVAAPISKLDAWVAKHGPALEGGRPKEGWNNFYDRCRDDCGGWRDKKNGKPAAGFSNKTIERRLQDAGFKSKQDK